MENSNSGVGKVIGAVLIGAAIGGILGVLFAPDKGSKTREKIMDKGHDLTDSVKEKFNSLISDLKREAQHTAENVKGAVKEEARNFNGKLPEDRVKSTQTL